MNKKSVLPQIWKRTKILLIFYFLKQFVIFGNAKVCYNKDSLGYEYFDIVMLFTLQRQCGVAFLQILLAMW